MNKFVKSKQLGDIAEEKIKNILDKIGEVCYNGDIRHDIQVSGPLNFTVEVKYDKYANKSGNIAVEYHNCKQDKPSGVMASHADFWIYYLNENEIYITSLYSLKDFVSKTEPYKTIIAGGDKNANLFLYKKEDIITIFTNLADLAEEETHRLFQQYCGETKS